VVTIREDLAGRGSDRLPGYLNYRLQVEGDSAFNTPNTFGVYMVGLVAKWLQDEIGGLEKMYELNRQKADLLYAAIDQSDGFYRPHARPESRSIMNVVFRLPSDELQAKFLAGAAERGLINLKGHRSVGGIRASIYNAMPLEGVERLDRYMREFQQQNAE